MNLVSSIQVYSRVERMKWAEVTLVISKLVNKQHFNRKGENREMN